MSSLWERSFRGGDHGGSAHSLLRLAISHNRDPDGLWSDLGAIRLPDWEPETCPCREWLEGILRCQLLVDVNSDPRRLVEVHISLLHLRAAGKDLLNHSPPAEIYILLNAKIWRREIHVALGRMIDRIDVSRAVPAGSHAA